MAALPDGTYEGVVLASKPTPKNRLHHIDILLTKTGERVEGVMFFGRERAVMLALARLKFKGAGQPWLPDQDRAALLPVLKIELSFDPKYPDNNRVLTTKRTGEFIATDVRHTTTRRDFIEF